DLFQERRLPLCLYHRAADADPADGDVDHLHQDLQGEVLMKKSLALRLLRDVTAVLVVGIFMFPLFWWGLTSFKPTSAIFNKDEVVFFDFEPTLVNYQVVLMGKSRAELAIESGSTFGVGGTSSYDRRQPIPDPLLVALASPILAIFAGLTAPPAAYRMQFHGPQAYLHW